MKPEKAPDNVVGWRARVPTKSGRGFWWVEVLAQVPGTYVPFLKVSGGRMAGKPWWISRRMVTDFVKPRKEDVR